MGYVISKTVEAPDPYPVRYLKQFDAFTSRWTAERAMATRFKYDDAFNALGALPGTVAEFVPETEGEKEFDKGTLWVTPDGTTYRLRDYGPDFTANDPWAIEVPSFEVQTEHGNYTVWKDLPSTARLIWHPKGK